MLWYHLHLSLSTFKDILSVKKNFFGQRLMREIKFYREAINMIIDGI